MVLACQSNSPSFSIENSVGAQRMLVVAPQYWSEDVRLARVPSQTSFISNIGMKRYDDLNLRAHRPPRVELSHRNNMGTWNIELEQGRYDKLGYHALLVLDSDTCIRFESVRCFRLGKSDG